MEKETLKQKRKQYIKSLPVAAKISIFLAIILIHFEFDESKITKYIRVERINYFNPLVYLLILLYLAGCIVSDFINSFKRVYIDVKDFFEDFKSYRRHCD